MENIDIDKLTPMMKIYCETKEQYKDCILFYRLGDFYEMFFDDALTASRELEITLTGKSCGLDERAPMCGIPYHAVEGYLNRLVAKGYKVAICEQVEDPKTAKGIVKREVVRIVTPGTNLDTQALDETKNNYIMCIVYIADRYGVAIADISTGDYFVTELPDSSRLMDEIYKFSPSEIICNEAFYMSGMDLDAMRDKLGITIYSLDSWYFDDAVCKDKLLEHFKVKNFAGLGLADYDCGIISAGALLIYLFETQKNSLSNLTHITPYITGKYMLIDSSTRRNLELVETLRLKERTYSLLWLLDKTKTAMGSRTLKTYIENPLVDKHEIERRYDYISTLLTEFILKEELRELLNNVYDLERLCGRISYGNLNARDLIQLKNSIKMLPHIKNILDEIKFDKRLEILEDLYNLLDISINEDSPVSIKEGNIIKKGYNKDLDDLKSMSSGGKDFILALEQKEKEKTGIKNLKVGFNKVFGYFIEVPNGQKSLIKDEYNYTRKQTLSNCERYITPELKEKEDLILNAEEKSMAMEYDLFIEIRDKVRTYIPKLQNISNIISEIDVLCSLAVVAEENNYVRPKLVDERNIYIKDARHPVVEKVSQKDYVPNDILMDEKTNILLITGPNMSGKSTYMRTLAIIIIMAQLGSFVPCKEASIPIFDKIFTRIGASDDLVSGESTFMVEMKEANNAVSNATKNSLILFDELGRGTATYDGMSLAQSILEYIHDKVKAKTLFSTHYHELTSLEKNLRYLKNVHVSAKEENGTITFLHKIKPGAVDKSYGIHVASLVNLPKEIITRASEILDLYENKKSKKEIYEQTSLSFDFNEEKESEVEKKLLEINPLEITPLEALNILDELKKEVINKK